jgi:hypothetical protein
MTRTTNVGLQSREVKRRIRDDDDRADAVNDVGISRERKRRPNFPTEGDVNRKGSIKDADGVISGSQAKAPVQRRRHVSVS